MNTETTLGILILIGAAVFFVWSTYKTSDARKEVNDQIVGFLEINGFKRSYAHTYTNLKCSIFVKGRELVVEELSGSYKYDNKQENLHDAPFYELVGYLVYNGLIEKDFKH